MRSLARELVLSEASRAHKAAAVAGKGAAVSQRRSSCCAHAAAVEDSARPRSSYGGLLLCRSFRLQQQAGKQDAGAPVLGAAVAGAAQAQEVHHALAVCARGRGGAA